MAISKPNRRGVLGGLAAVPLLGFAPARKKRSPRVLSATPNVELTEAFTKYGDSGAGWTGADGAYSAALPGGIQLWSYSDTFLGPVNPDGSRPRTTPFLNNSFVLRKGNQISTVHGGTADQPDAVVKPATEGNWYWAGANLVDGPIDDRVLQLVCLEFRRTGSGMFDFEWLRNAVARLDVSSLEVLELAPLPSGAEVAWGMWLRTEGSYTYVYGVEDRQQDKYLRIARVPGTDLRGTWEYYDGSGWSGTESDSARVLHGIGNEFSVTVLPAAYGDRYLLVTQDTTTPFSPDIVAFFADSPVGPFADKTVLYSTPETGGNIITHSAHDHPELRNGNTLLVTYCVNSIEPDDLYADVSIYRPRYLDVTLSA